MSENLLDRPATIGDILAWNLAIPAALAAWFLPYLGFAVVPRFQRMFDSLGGKLPAVTVFIAGYGGPFTLALALLAVAMVLVALFRIRGQPERIALIVAANLLIYGGIGLVVLAIFYPILELQSAVRGG